MCCDCVRVVQSNLTALYLFFLFLFLFVMYVYILCKEGREFTKQLLRVRTRIYFQSVYYPVFIPFSWTNHLFLFARGSKIQNNNRDFDFPPYFLFVVYRNTYKTHTLLPLS